MLKLPNGIAITYDLGEMNALILCRFIQSSHWGSSLTKAQIMKAFSYSSCVGLLHDGSQVGFARAVSDRTISAYLKDVFVLEAFRNKGFGRLLIQELFTHPDLADVTSWYLGTKDAHGFYKSLGFKNAPDGIYMYRQHAPADNQPSSD